MLITVTACILCAAALAALICACITRHPVRVFTASGIAGLIILVALCVSRHYWGFGLNFNLYSLASSVMLGPAGVLMLLVVNIL